MPPNHEMPGRGKVPSAPSTHRQNAAPAAIDDWTAATRIRPALSACSRTAPPTKVALATGTQPKARLQSATKIDGLPTRTGNKTTPKVAMPTKA